MKRLIAIPILLVAGCAPYVQVQMDLVRQARHGVELSGAYQQSLQDQQRQFAEMRRRRLDDAFDADVRSQASLEAAWVIEHRRAYAIALDAFASEEAEQARAAETARQNLAAMDAALEQLLSIQSIQLRFIPPGGTSHEP